MILYLSGNGALVPNEKDPSGYYRIGDREKLDGISTIREYRANLRIAEGTFDLTMIVNYMDTLAKLTGKMRQDVNKTNRFIEPLDMGYFPYIMLPITGKDVDTSILEEGLEKSGLSSVRRVVYDLEGKALETSIKDIYLSKIEINRKYNIPYSKMNYVQVVKTILDTEGVKY